MPAPHPPEFRRRAIDLARQPGASVAQVAKDRYGRLLRYVMKSGKDGNRMMVARGHARVYVYDHKPFKRTRRYKAAQAAAKRDDRGLRRARGR